MSSRPCRVRGAWNETCQPGRFLQLSDFENQPFPPIAAYTELRQVQVVSSSFTRFSRAAFDGAGSGIDIAFWSCTADWQRLLDELIVNGAGRWKIKGCADAGALAPLLKEACKLGQDFVGNPRLRRIGFALLRGQDPGRLTPEDLQVADWSKKVIRQRALAWFAEQLPRHTPQGALFLMGKPSIRKIGELKAGLKAAGLRVVTKIGDADYAVLMERPGRKLAEARAAGLDLVCETQLETMLDGAAETGIELTPGQAAKVSTLLSSPETVNQGLLLAEQAEPNVDLLTELVVIMLFGADKKARAAAKKLVLTQAPRPVIARFQGDRSRYSTMVSADKLRALIDEMGTLGLDTRRFAYGMALARATRSRWHTDKLVHAAAPYVDTSRLCRALSHVKCDYFTWSGALVEGMHHLQIENLRLSGGPVDLTLLAKSPIRDLRLESTHAAAWQLAPLIACPNLAGVTCHVPCEGVAALKAAKPQLVLNMP